jgi:hypothetical protein
MIIKATPAQIGELVRRGATLGPVATVIMPRARGRIHRHEVGRMNKLESAYSDHLNRRKGLGDVFAWGFEQWKLRLADKTWYMPDYWVQLSDGTLEFHEVKATWADGKPGWTEDARVKWKATAEKYPMFRFVAAWLVNNRSWEFEVYRGE